MSEQTMSDVAEMMAKMTGLELLRAAAAMPEQPPNIAKLFDFEIVEIEFGRTSARLTNPSRFREPTRRRARRRLRHHARFGNGMRRPLGTGTGAGLQHTRAQSELHSLRSGHRAATDRDGNDDPRRSKNGNRRGPGRQPGRQTRGPRNHDLHHFGLTCAGRLNHLHFSRDTTFPDSGCAYRDAGNRDDKENPACLPFFRKSIVRLHRHRNTPRVRPRR